MQPDRLTIKSQEALAAAARLAQERRNPQVTPVHLLAVLTPPPVAGPGRRGRRHGRPRTQEAGDRAPGAARGVEPRPGGPAPPRRGLLDRRRPALRRTAGGAARGREAREGPLRRVHLHRAPAAGARRGQEPRRPGAARRGRQQGSSAAGARRGAGPAPRDRPESGGEVPGARALRARLHEARRGRARSTR